MQVLSAPLPTRGPAQQRPPPVAAALPAAYPAAWVAVIVLASVCTLPVLALVNARGVPVSAGMVAMIEALIFALCIGVQLQRVPPWTLALGLCLLSWVVLTWLVRQRPDFKSVRDLLIPLLFISLGRLVADTAFAERLLRAVTVAVVAVALFEALLPDTYGTVFNAFSFYAKLGSIRESAAMFGGQTLTLNGYRPEGIGRTLLPAVLGMHRTSSIFLEPVSLGNFAVILLAWNLSRAWADLGRSAWLMIAAALLLVVLSDSRFGMVMVLVVLGYRLLPDKLAPALALAYPFVLLCALLGLATFYPQVGDNLLGRISASGQALLRFDAARILGLDSPLPGFGDMGYAYVLSRLGAPQVIGLLVALFLIPTPSARARRLRGLIVLYVFSSLAISGTSVFALKTAGLMWFVWGALSADGRLPAQPLKWSKA